MAVSQPNELPYLYSIYGHHRRFHERMGVSLCFETRDGTLHQCLKRLLAQKLNLLSFIILMFVPNPFFLLWATKDVRDLFHFHCIFFPDNKKVNGVWRHHSSKLKNKYSLRMNYPFKTKAVFLIFIHIKVSALNCVLCSFWEARATGCYSQACPIFLVRLGCGETTQFSFCVASTKWAVWTNEPFQYCCCLWWWICSGWYQAPLINHKVFRCRDHPVLSNCSCEVMQMCAMKSHICFTDFIHLCGSVNREFNRAQPW